MHLDWFGIVGWFFTFFGLLGNSWVIFIIARRRRLQTTTKWCIGGRSGWYLRESSAVSMICDMFVNTCNKRVRLISADFFIEASIICLTAMIAERYITIVHSFKYVRFLTSSRTVVIIASCWTIPFLFAICQTIIHLGSSEHFVADMYKFDIIYKMFFALLSIIFLFVAHLHILLIACKLSREMKSLFKQVRFNIGANSVRKMEVTNVGLKTSTVRLVTKLVIIFLSCYGLGIHNIICVYLNLCVPSKHENLLVLIYSKLHSKSYDYPYKYNNTSYTHTNITIQEAVFLCNLVIKKTFSSPICPLNVDNVLIRQRESWLISLTL